MAGTPYGMPGMSQMGPIQAKVSGSFGPRGSTAYGAFYHGLGSFRQAVLEKSEVRQLLIDFWLGHENPDMSSRYAKQLTEDMEFRQEWTKKVGLGLELPELSESEPGVNCATCATDSVEHVCIANA